jgi:NAD(P)-dependent dehydrogenase (short-subunit alcohol dehydrogenase family)
MMSLRRKTVLITGAAARVGRAIALDLATDGWAVAVHYNRSEAAAAAVVDKIVGAGGEAALVRADLGEEEQTAGLIGAAASALGRPLDALVNNASSFEKDSLTTMTRASWDLHMEANLRAPCVLAQAFAAALPEGRSGAIVNLVDQRVRKPTPQFFSYAISKAALAWVTVTMAQALAPRIRVNAIAPGPTLRNSRQTEADWQAQVEATLLRSGSPPDEIVAAVRYLLSASAVTGQILVVDGGQHLAWKTADVWGIAE